MAIKKNVLDALNKQIAHEFHAKQLYLSMCAYFEVANLKGFAHWMKKQADEEDAHAMKIFDFINDRDGKIELDKIEKPKSGWRDSLHAVQDALAHERKVTGLIHNLRNIAVKEKDHATEVFLNWFVSEQVEEEEQAQWLADQVKLVKDGAGLLVLDQELSKRE